MSSLTAICRTHTSPVCGAPAYTSVRLVPHVCQACSTICQACSTICQACSTICQACSTRLSGLFHNLSGLFHTSVRLVPHVCQACSTRLSPSELSRAQTHTTFYTFRLEKKTHVPHGLQPRKLGLAQRVDTGLHEFHVFLLLRRPQQKQNQNKTKIKKKAVEDRSACVLIRYNRPVKVNIFKLRLNFCHGP